jgi:hypothetical protein
MNWESLAPDNEALYAVTYALGGVPMQYSLHLPRSQILSAYLGGSSVTVLVSLRESERGPLNSRMLQRGAGAARPMLCIMHATFTQPCSMQEHASSVVV